MTKDKYIIIGKIGAPHGIRGWLKIQSYTENKDQIFSYQPWYLFQQDIEQVCIVEQTRLQHDTLFAKLKGIETPEAARLLTGKEIAIPREQLPTLKQNEYYWNDLIGLTVINQDGQPYGKVIYLMATGSNDVLVIKNTKEHAIPFIWDEVILSVDLIKKEIRVKWDLI